MDSLLVLANWLTTLIEDFEYSLSENRAIYNRLAAKPYKLGTVPLSEDPDYKAYWLRTDYLMGKYLGELEAVKASLLGEAYTPPS